MRFESLGLLGMLALAGPFGVSCALMYHAYERWNSCFAYSCLDATLLPLREVLYSIYEQ